MNLDKMKELVVKAFAKDAARAENEMEKNFYADGKAYLVRCPECGKENYVPAVILGRCAWCGYNSNKEENEKES